MVETVVTTTRTMINPGGCKRILASGIREVEGAEEAETEEEEEVVAEEDRPPTVDLRDMSRMAGFCLNGLLIYANK